MNEHVKMLFEKTRFFGQNGQTKNFILYILPLDFYAEIGYIIATKEKQNSHFQGGKMAPPKNPINTGRQTAESISHLWEGIKESTKWKEVPKQVRRKAKRRKYSKEREVAKMLDTKNVKK